MFEGLAPILPKMDKIKSSKIPEVLTLYAIHCLLPATLLLTTPKRSTLRYLSIPCSIWIAYRAINLAAELGPGFIWCEFARLTLSIVLQSFNWLLLNPKDINDLPVEAGHGVSRLYYVARLFYQPRGIRTPWQIKNAPQQPGYYQRRGLKEPSRGRFLVRQSVIAVWQYLALDLFATLALQQALEQEKHGALPSVVQWGLSVEQWIERLISNLVAGFVVSRILIDFHHRAFSIIVVGLGLDSPSNCPPLFGKAGDADTMRGFWA
jgi:hypothetical protein